MTTPDFSKSLALVYGSPPPAVAVHPLLGDASTRRYFRVVPRDPGNGPRSLIVMQLPEDALSSDEGGAQPRPDRLPFLEVGELLGAADIPVPTIHAVLLERGQVLLEDLGDTTFERHLRTLEPSGWGEPYSLAVALLAQIHERLDVVPAESIVAKRRFDRALLGWELDHFVEWGLSALFGALPEPQANGVARDFAAIIDEIEAMPLGFVHRDYQSKNLMVSPEGGLTVIDYQDAMIGPRTYDLVALLCDSYVDIPIELQEAMIERYAALRGADAAAVRREFWVVALHRKLKDAGRFVYIDRVRKNPSFLQWYPQSLRYVGRALRQTGRFDALSDVLGARIPDFPDSVAKPPSSMK